MCGHTKLDNKRGIGIAHNNLAGVYVQKDDVNTGITHHEHAVDNAEDIKYIILDCGF